MHCKAFKPFYDISSPDPPVLYGYQAAHLEGVWIRAQNTRRDVMYGAGELKWCEDANFASAHTHTHTHLSLLTQHCLH